MSGTIRVEAARIPDRDRLLEALRDEGLDAEPKGEVDIIVPVGDGVIFSVGAPFIPTEHEGVIYIRPPVG
jgi:hypothetical protein